MYKCVSPACRWLWQISDFANSKMNKNTDITADPLLCSRLVMFAAKHLPRCIIFLSAFLPFNLCFIKALIIHNTGSNSAIILQTLLLGRENTALQRRGEKKSHRRVPPRDFTQSIEKINYSHAIHLALLLDWQKMLLGLSAVLLEGNGGKFVP